MKMILRNVVLMFLFFGLVSCQNHTIQDACTHITNHLYQQAPIFIGILSRSSRLLFILPSDELYVYDLPLESLYNDTLLISSDARPERMQDKWPKANWSIWYQWDGKVKPFGLTTFWDVSWWSEYLLFRESEPNPRGDVHVQLYNINRQTATNKTVNFGTKESKQNVTFHSFDFPQLVSSIESNTFYEFVYEIVGQDYITALVEYHIDPSLSGSKMVKRMDPPLRICCDFRTQDICFFSTNRCPKHHLGEVRSGFVFEERFYLFGKTGVVILEEDMIYHLEENFEVKRVDYRDWIRCGGETQILLKMLTPKNANRASFLVIFTAATMSSVLLLTIFVLFIMYKCSLKPTNAVLQ